MEEEQIEELDKQIMEIIEEHQQDLYTKIMEKVMATTGKTVVTITETSEVTSLDEDGVAELELGEVVIKEHPPKESPMDQALEDARTKTNFTVTEDPETPAPAQSNMETLTDEDIQRMKMVDQGGLNEDTKGNKESLQRLSMQQHQRQENVGKRPLPDLESRKVYFLKIIDQKFARQVPIDCEHVRQTVLSYKTIDDREYEEVMLSFIKEGMVKKVNETNWFFMTQPSPEAPPPVAPPAVAPAPTVEEQPEEVQETEPVEEEKSPEDPSGELVEDQEEIDRSKMIW